MWIANTYFKFMFKFKFIVSVEQHKFYQGGRHWNTSIVHMRDQRNVKKGLFFETKRDSRESRLGVKMCLFSRKSRSVNFPAFAGIPAYYEVQISSL